jgi:hypothetical protein
MTRHRRVNDLIPTLEYEARFWNKIDQSGGPEACWPWTAARSRLPYGLFTAFKGKGGKMTSAHSVAFRLAYDPIPEGLSVLHSCDNSYESTYEQAHTFSINRVISIGYKLSL